MTVASVGRVTGSGIAGAFGALAPPPADCFPAEELQSDRLLLRAYRASDTEFHREVFDHEVARRWSIAPQPYPREASRRWCTDTAERIRTSGDGICWAVVDRPTGQFLGMAGLHRTDWSTRVAEVSGTAGAVAIGRGQATRVLRLLCHWALSTQHLNALRIVTHGSHRGPALVARACGFVTDERREGDGADTLALRLDAARATAVPPPDFTVRPSRPSVPSAEVLP